MNKKLLESSTISITLYNFIVDNIFIWIRLHAQIYMWITDGELFKKHQNIDFFSNNLIWKHVLHLCSGAQRDLQVYNLQSFHLDSHATLEIGYSILNNFFFILCFQTIVGGEIWPLSKLYSLMRFISLKLPTFLFKIIYMPKYPL